MTSLTEWRSWRSEMGRRVYSRILIPGGKLLWARTLVVWVKGVDYRYEIPIDD
jgi:hypothetical protein